MSINRFVNMRTGTAYTFPVGTSDQDFSPRLQNLETHITALPGVDGGYDEDGMGRSNAGNGTVQFSIYLVARDRADMQAKRDALHVISSWGVGALYDRLNGADRWAYGRVTNIDMAEQRQGNTDLFQRVQLSFLVNPPFWHTAGNMLIWDSGWLWDDGTLWDSSSSVLAVNGSGSTTKTNNGSAITLPVLTAKYNSGTVSDITFKRVVNGENVDLVNYSGSLVSGEYLEIDCLRQRASIQPNGVNVYSQLRFEHPDWFRLEPGSNAIAVTCNGATDCSVLYMERWK